MKIGQRDFDLDHQFYIMGILNVTPDSFSDGGKWNSPDKALAHAEEMINAGCDIIDVGGESTRPHYLPVDVEEEIDRVVPVIKALKSHFDVPVSLDTYKAETARAGVDAGADMINDIRGGLYDDRMPKVIADSGVPCVLMHGPIHPEYTDFLSDVKRGLLHCVENAVEAGVSKDKIILDPGIGFGKSLEQNLSLMNHLEDIRDLGYPVLLGTSRKSMIAKVLNLPADERVEGTLATTVIGMMKGCSIFRVHDVKENKRALDMTAAVLKAE